ncbi:hypothetical protein [Amycolatopsis sp. CA-230715]|uniref:hypothetical protein n=1 Tax=Amycolatopsis sp. CA-230715 TaxID=2745196 RepID=UPI001C01E79D|nr:hypothetical protein [Amycolatopsis sp. CA-230715]
MDYIKPFTTTENGETVMCYPVTFDGRKITVTGPDGPRTRTRRARTGYATAATLRAMGYNDLRAVCPDGTADVFGFTTRAN